MGSLFATGGREMPHASSRYMRWAREQNRRGAPEMPYASLREMRSAAARIQACVIFTGPTILASPHGADHPLTRRPHNSAKTAEIRHFPWPFGQQIVKRTLIRPRNARGHVLQKGWGLPI
jgi:hypothetical protein